jgi:hypothetical protein
MRRFPPEIEDGIPGCVGTLASPVVFGGIDEPSMLEEYAVAL